MVPQFNTLDRSLTVYENLYFHCRYFGFSSLAGKARTLELLEQFLLTERKGVYPAQLSGGLAQRVQIARAIAHRPTVLFLDEPSAGLDPQSRMAMWKAVAELRKEGITVLLTTHYMEEADSLSDRVAIIDYGRVLALGSPEKLKTTFGAQTIFDLKLKSLAGIEKAGDPVEGAPGRDRRRDHGRRSPRDGAPAPTACCPTWSRRLAGPASRPDRHRAQPGNGLHQLTGRDLRE